MPTWRRGPGCARVTTNRPASANTASPVKAASTCSPCWWNAPGPPRSNGRLKASYHRLVIRFGGYRNPVAKKRAIVAIAHTLIVIIWHVLATGKTYTDLGEDFYTPPQGRSRKKETQRLLARLQALGHEVTLTPAA